MCEKGHKKKDLANMQQLTSFLETHHKPANAFEQIIVK